MAQKARVCARQLHDERPASISLHSDGLLAEGDVRGGTPSLCYIMLNRNVYKFWRYVRDVGKGVSHHIIVSDVSPAKLSTLPGYRDFLRVLRERYNLKSIDAINVVKRGLSMVRRLKPDLSIQDFYLLVDTVVSQCVKSGGVDLNEFEKLLKHYISKHEAREAEPAPLAEEKREIEELLQDVKEKLVDFALKFENTGEFEEWFKAWCNEVLSDVRLWRNIAEKAKSIDFGELMKSIRLSREA